MIACTEDLKQPLKNIKEEIVANQISINLRQWMTDLKGHK